MTQLPIFTALSLPAVSVLPSLNSIRWTGDGQALLLTKSAVHILTPELGVSGDINPDVKQGLDTDHSGSSDKLKPFGWLRTMIGFDRTLAHQWAADCQDWGSVALGSIDPTLRAVSASPSNLTAHTGCVLAVLNSNLELTIWGPLKNHLKGEWIKLQDVTQYLKTACANETASALSNTLQAQITCIEWSSQADFNFSPAPNVDASLLAAGNKAGRVILFRFVGNNDEKNAQVCYVDIVSVADRWVNHLAWSAWSMISRSHCEALLACASVDGSIRLLKITQSAQCSPSSAAFYPAYQLERTLEPEDVRICDPDGRGITGLRWIEDVTGRSTLVYCKPGTVHLWRRYSPAHEWYGLRELRLQTQKLSVGSSSLSALSGIDYIRRLDAVVLTLSDGSFHAIHGLSTNPSLNPGVHGLDVTSESLSRAARSVFYHVETDATSAKYVNCINGMITYDNAATFTWIHETARPTDFSYKHDAKHISTFVVAQLSSEYPDDQFMHDLGGSVLQVSAAHGDAPVHTLRGAFLHLRDPSRLARLHVNILTLLQHSLPSDTTSAIPLYTGGLNAAFHRDFTDSLFAHLFGSNTLLSQRLKLSLANYCRENAAEQETKQYFAQAAQGLAAAIMRHVLTIIIKHIRAIATILTPDDALFVLRIVDQASLVGSPDLRNEAQELSDAARSIYSRDDQSSPPVLDEKCPACHANIPFNDLESAACSNGHTWARCSISTLILSTPSTRTCMCCGRKALLPSSEVSVIQDWPLHTARSCWLLQDLLNAAKRCLSCGGQFVTLV